MKKWHLDHLENLVKGIINEFNYLKPKVKKDDSIYAVALTTDEDVMTAFLSLSSKNAYLENCNEYGYWSERWSSAEWGVAVGRDVVNGGISELYLADMYLYYNEYILPKLSVFNEYTEERNDFVELYTEALKLAKASLVKQFGDEISLAIFFLDVPGEPNIAIQSAKKINAPSILLDEMIQDIG